MILLIDNPLHTPRHSLSAKILALGVFILSADTTRFPAHRGFIPGRDFDEQDTKRLFMILFGWAV